MANRTVNINGKEVEMYEIEPLNSSEKWNEYQMPNGDILRVKLILTRAFTNNDKPDGIHQNYSFDFKTISDVITTDLKGK